MSAEVIAQTGPGAVKPTAPVAKATTPTPPPATGAASATAATAAAAYEAEVVALKAQLVEAQKNAQKRSEVLLQRQKAALMESQKKEREGLSSKLSRLDALEKSQAQAKINKTAYLKSLYGDDWYDQIVTERVNGGAPTADVVASEIGKLREEMEAKFEAREKARAEEHAATSQKQQAQSLADARQQLGREASQMFAAKSAEFPLVVDLGPPEAVAAELARRVEEHYWSTVKRGASGEILEDGEIIPLTKMAEQWESQLVAVAEKAAAAPKYADRFKPKSAGQPRFTLTNDLTGSTSAKRPPVNDDERRARAIAAYEANARKA